LGWEEEVEHVRWE
jgi:hypothetical protein